MLSFAHLRHISSPQEEKLKDKPGYEHLNEPLHILLEAEFPEDMIDSRVDHAVAILEKLLKPVVCVETTLLSFNISFFLDILHFCFIG